MPIQPSPAVLRACDILEHLAAHPSDAYSVSELARRLGIPRATCDAVLLALADRRLVDRRPGDRRFTLGVACITVGDAARVAGSLLGAVGPPAEDLARGTRTCVALVSRDGSQCRVDRVFDHGPAFGARARAGEAVPLVAPFGAVFVAWDHDGLDRWLDGAGALHADERHRYREALDAVRARGYSIGVANVRPELAAVLEDLVDHPDAPQRLRERDALIRDFVHSEYLPVALDTRAPQRVNQMSAPVFDRRGRVAMAIMLMGPSYELTATEIDALAERLLAAAGEATARLGGHAPDVEAPGDEQRP